MTANQIYLHFQLPPVLQLHQLRVASVAEQIFQLINFPNTDTYVQACLVHDLGNMIKFDFSQMRMAKFLEPEGVEYWQKIQQDQIEKYGVDEEKATLTMLTEIEIAPEIVAIVAKLTFPFIPEIHDSPNLGLKISKYADMRVAPGGVVSLQERLADLKIRYQNRYPNNEPEMELYHQYLYDIEQQIIDQTQLDPTQITDDSINDRIPQLKQTQLTSKL